MQAISEEKQVVLNIFKARIKMGLDLLFLNSSCLLMKATVFKVRFFHRQYKGKLLDVSYLTLHLLEFGDIVGTGI